MGIIKEKEATTKIPQNEAQGLSSNASSQENRKGIAALKSLTLSQNIAENMIFS